MTLFQNITENRLRHASVPVHTNHSVTYINTLHVVRCFCESKIRLSTCNRWEKVNLAMFLFQTYLGISRPDFVKSPRWKQLEIRKERGLFWNLLLQMTIINNPDLSNQNKTNNLGQIFEETSQLLKETFLKISNALVMKLHS